MLLLLANLCTILFYATASPQALGDEIASLPGQPPVDFKQYGGYVEINSTTHASIFYWFQVCEKGIDQCPLFLWTNGGPGCSGIQAGLTEQGAFRIQPNGTLSLNQYRWNKYVNIVFIEQPIGVGFSTSTDPNDYINGDESSAKDMYEFILGFYKIFPSLQKQDFYLSSESYGGHYCPMGAKYIIDHDTTNKIPFKGFLVGNPLTDPLTNKQGRYGTFFGHQLVAYPIYNKWVNECDNGRNTNQTCQQLQQTMSQQKGNVFGEGLDFPVCLNPDDHDALHNKYYYSYYSKLRGDFFMDTVYYGAFGEAKPVDYNFKSYGEYGTDNPPYNCLKDYSSTYMNRQDVRSAMHVSTSFNGSWKACANIHYNGTDVNSPMQPIYQYLIKSGAGLHMTIYSGDDDSNCATMGLQFWMYNQSWTIEKGWTPWYYESENNGQQTGGYYVKFKSAVNFITIHTAGHETPFFRPLKSALVLQKYLANEI
eukprot:173126_1